MGSLDGKKIALIGGAGFIGHHLALEATKRGAEVHAIDGLQVNNLLSLMSEGVENRDLRRAQAVRREDRDRLQPGLRHAVHHHPAVGAIWCALREPPCRSGLRRDRARGWQAARRW